jgi:chromosomal replication initiator protein
MTDLSNLVDIEVVWRECLKVLEATLERPTYEICLKDSKPVSIAKNTISIGITSFARNWLKKKGNCRDLITKTIHGLTGKNYIIQFETVNGNGSSREPQEVEPEKKEEKNIYPVGQPDDFLNPRYTFDSFVVGDGNNLAHAACLAVSSSPGEFYNPLFIYGGSGLGKTHLLMAVGHKVLLTNKKTKVSYISTEKFTNELIRSLEQRRMVEFKEKYRNIDVLLIDDIHFLINKEKTQEEFFHTFNALHEARKQIVISSDRTPKEIPTLHERLRTRFEWGLIADIQPPDIETREAILRKKAESEKTPVPLGVISYIAEKIPSNIRELEGALIRVIAFASVHKRPISLELAYEALKGILPDTKNKLLTPEIIQKKVSEYFGIRQVDIVSEKRDQRFSFPRQIAMYLTRELTTLSTPDTAKAFGKKDHSTVLHACRKITSLTDDPTTKSSLENIKNMLKEY